LPVSPTDKFTQNENFPLAGSVALMQSRARPQVFAGARKFRALSRQAWRNRGGTRVYASSAMKHAQVG
jgi:hypothetical protein